MVFMLLRSTAEGHTTGRVVPRKPEPMRNADPNLLTSPASENKISHLHKFGSDRILDISLILCSVVIVTRETKKNPERPADVAMPVQAVRVGHSLSFRRSRGSPGYSTWGACRGSNSRAGHCTFGTFLKATPKSGSYAVVDSRHSISSPTVPDASNSDSNLPTFPRWKLLPTHERRSRPRLHVARAAFMCG